ncbi:N-acetylmuramoyl-L-alanine amidase [Streptomyces boluensis]|uniref:N-acetylmuramoyl-L-alanine amidase n=1 Tax=Streptomyces boluensis TaxID=1775135 RepID=A0A964UN98_9ACTN|nr:peptidoglycan recognition family protein [Streptomyces boluensis]NBE52181.1 N-acetylmuramoyl-L-alanine amidase [Streptomyces boluensis]
MADEQSGDGKQQRSGRGISRRGLLIGGAVTVGAGATLFHEELGRLWWRVPGIDKQRNDGDVDHAGAQWIAASEANLRYADRPADFTVDRVVIHVTEGSYATAVRVFRDPLHAAAAHYLIRGKDGHIAQMARELDVAFHAGNRSYNERSIGIEHEGFVDKPETLTDVMYRSSARLTADICARYEIPVDRKHIIGHNEVPDATHTDPGPHWDWDKYIRLVRAAAKDGAKDKA